MKCYFFLLNDIFLKYKYRKITLYFIQKFVNLLVQEKGYRCTSIYECTVEDFYNFFFLLSSLVVRIHLIRCINGVSVFRISTLAYNNVLSLSTELCLWGTIMFFLFMSAILSA